MTFSSLPKEVLNKIREYHCPTIHPAAQLIKQLVFVRDEECEQFADGYPSVCVYGGRFVQSRGPNPTFRRYLFTDFTEPDRYIQDSVRDSGFILGQVRNDRQELIRRIGTFYDDFTYTAYDNFTYTAAGILDRPLA